MTFSYLHPRERVAEILRRVYEFGMTTTSGGNISMKDDEGNVWITPSAVDKGSLTAADIVCVKVDGSVQGLHPPSSEWPFHQAIYEIRPDLRAILHAHPPMLVSFSISRKIPDTRIIPQAYHVCGPVGYAPYELPGSEELGRSIAREFARGIDAVIMENHGTVVGGRTLLEAFARFETLEFCAATQMQAALIGQVHTLNEEQIAAFDHRNHIDMSEFSLESHSAQELDQRGELIRLLHRAYRQKLIISTFGTFSVRLGEDDFLITPSGRDRYYLQREDLVRIREGRREKGKIPSRATFIHRRIYLDHTDIRCIIFAQSPYATAYAVAHEKLDTRTIPESYILLREMPLAPYGSQFGDGAALSALLSPQTPILLLANDSILVTGDAPLATFDRLEVAEFSARSLTQARTLGPLQPIGQEEIGKLKEKFKLD